MRVLNILKNKRYLALAIVSGLIMVIVFPLLQVQATGGLQNLDLWFEVIPPLNLALVVVFSVLFGLLLSFQVYNFKSKICSVQKKAASATGGGFAAFLGILVPACPACISIVTLILPVSLGISVAGFFMKYSSLLLSGSIALLLLGIYLLGGFKKV